MKYIIGNWKLNGNRGLAAEFAKTDFSAPDRKVILCVPHTMLDARIPNVDIGAEDVSAHISGGMIGEVSAEMVREAGAKYSLVGHPTRRKDYGETDETVRAKAVRCIEAGLIPIVCVTSVEMAAGSCPENGDFLIAYEPVSAIGTGFVPTDEEISNVHNGIKAALPGRSVLYGGSVKPENAAAILSIPGVDGVLVGGASLKAEQFKGIVDAR